MQARDEAFTESNCERDGVIPGCAQQTSGLPTATLTVEIFVAIVGAIAARRLAKRLGCK